MKSVEDLHTDLVIALSDYLDNQGSDDADLFYHTYFQAYNAYWKAVDPSKMKEKWN